MSRPPASPEIPLARVALLAGEAFGHHSAEAALSNNPVARQARSALAIVVVVCAMAVLYLAL